ncbi:MAG TPA: SDR family oxidoreductase [Thermoanaerobaculia bacterium]|nr:SDR family oxidoreductase [Thermoanaerobaculia bacterium]
MGGKRVAIVTGGTRGIGRAIAERLAVEGYCVVLSGRTAKSAEEAAAALRQEGHSAVGAAADARKEEDQRGLVELARREHGRLDVLVNNAGIGEFGRVDELSPERFRDVLETNVFGPFYAIRHAVPLMKETGGGFIVNIASLAAVNAFAGGSAYNASKFGLLGLSDAAMLDLRHEGIRVAVVMPGSVGTEWTHSHGNRDVSWMLSPEDVAEAVADLLRFPGRAIASRIELRPSRPPRK